MAEGARTRFVLFVTDEDGLREGAAFAFPADVEISHAQDAREAWETLRTSTPAVAVVDLRTGSAGGFALAKDMLSVPRLAKIPILMLIERSQDTWLARQAGAAEWLAPPFDIAEIADKALELAGAHEK